MNFINFTVRAFIFSVFCSSVFAAEPHQYPGWDLYWVDNFNGNQLDPNRWRIGYPWNSRTHNHRGYAHESNIVVQNGNLYLYAGGGRTGDRYNTGVISALEQITFDDPDVEWVIEARMMLANRNGIWPAFWLNSTGGWPNINEIDIMEQQGWGNQNNYESVMHFSVNSGNRPSQHRTVNGGNNLDYNWHRYGVAIKKNEVKIMFDSRTVNRVTGNRKNKLRQKTFNIILNSAIGGAWGGDGYQNWIDDFNNRSRFIIDYVAVYRRGANNGPAPTSTPNPGNGGNNGDSGIRQVNNNTGVIFFRDEGWSANWHYICLDSDCRPGERNNGYYERQVDNLTSGQQYRIQFKVQDNQSGQYISPEETVTFN